MNVGDLFFSFRGDGARLQADAKTQGGLAGDVAGASMGQRLSLGLRKSFTGANISKGLVQGLGIGAALGAVSLAESAVGKLQAVIGESITAFNAQQASIDKLGTALTANVPGWNGDTTAIEANIKAHEKLGFTDVELRNSMTFLVGATHDVAEAQQIQNVAMDLARYKSISLADASDALTKVEAGSYRILKSLGIELPKGATQMQALAAVEKLATNQAADFAATNEGKLLVSQVKVNDAMEKFGKEIAPLQVQAVTAIADGSGTFVDTLGVLGNISKPVFDNLSVGVDKTDQGIADLIVTAIHLGDAIGGIPGPWHKTAEQVAADTASMNQNDAETAQQFRNAAKDMADQSGATSEAIKANFGTIVTAEQTVAIGARTAAQTASYWWGTYKDNLVTDTNILIKDAFGPLLAGDALVAKNAEIAAQKAIIAAGGVVPSKGGASTVAAQDAVTKAHERLTLAQMRLSDIEKKGKASATSLAAAKFAVRDASAALSLAEGKLAGQTDASTASRKKDTAAVEAARVALHQLDMDQATMLLDLANAGATTSQAYRNGIANLKDEIRNASGPTKKFLQDILDQLNVIQVASTRVNVLFGTSNKRAPGTAVRRASGGPVTAGMPYLVNENTLNSELFVPSASGTIYPQLKAVPGAGASGNAPTINVAMEGLPLHVETPFEVSQQLLRVATMHLIRPRR